MKLLYLHADYIEWEPTKPALRTAEQVSREKRRVEDSLVVMVAVEEGDDEKTAEKAVTDIEEHYARIKPHNIVLYPWVHLTQRPGPVGKALSLIKDMEKILREKGYVVYRAPFGWYKAFTISVKGHPLAELSRTF